MAEGAGSKRIVVAPRVRPPSPSAVPAAARASARAAPMSPRGWTPRRLGIAGALGGAAAIAGAVVFRSGFGMLGGGEGPRLAVGFGLFAIGMIVFCAALVALAGIVVGAVAEQRGWARTAGAIAAPLAIVWALWGLGAVGYAVPAVVSLVLIGGVVAALR